MVEVVVTDEFLSWYETELTETENEAVFEAVETLKAYGVALKFPQSSQIKGTKYALRELRVQAHGDPIRIIYAFDPKRQAVLLIGACKTGQDRFYKVYVPRAEKLWESYIEETDQ